LRVARQLGKERNVFITTTFLGAHAIPPEFTEKPDDYIEFVCEKVLPAVHSEKLADAVDGFCENIAFSPKQISKVFEKARTLGLPVKIHAEQLSNLGGASLAANFGALSADHLEYLDEAGVEAMVKSGTVAVLLPGAFYTLRETQLPPINSLRKAGVQIAVATDCNPGSSPLTSLLLCFPNNAYVIASITLDFPAPLSPTKIVTPSLNSNFVSECDKKSTSSIDLIMVFFLFEFFIIF